MVSWFCVASDMEGTLTERGSIGSVSVRLR